MGFIFGIIKRLIKWTLYFVVFATVIVLIPNLPPYTKFTSIQLEPTLLRVGPLAPNSALNNVEKLYKDKVVGPEAFQFHNGELYTSLGTGEIVKLSPGGHVTFVTKIGPPCTGLAQEHICGRPLGFQIDEKQNKMYVADAYHGIWRVDLKTDKKQLLVSPQVEIEGRAPKLFNFLALDKNGDLYWTDSSSDFQLRDGAYTGCVDPSGRLFHYNAAKNQSKVLLDNLWFPNGVVLSPDNQFVVISETFGYRLLKYYISGPKKGKSEVFIGGLPGAPDNLRVLPDGSGLLVPLYVTFDAASPLLTRSLAAAPAARKLLARALAIAEAPFQFMQQHFPHPVLEDIVYKIGNFKSMSAIAPGECGLVHIDWAGRVVAAYYNNDGSMPKISDAIVFNDKLYLGNPHDEHVAALPAPPSLKKAFAGNVEPKAEKKEAPKPVKVEQPKVAEKPKVQEKKVEVKQAPQKQDPKPVPTKTPEPAKPASKPVESKPKSQEVPKPAQPKPTPPPKKVETPKAEQKPTTPKPAEPKPKSAPKPETKPAAPKTETKPPGDAAKPKPSEAKKPESKPQKEKEAKPAKAIPIKEEIPSDTAKPNKETLKVIKKGGPAEIPNPNLV